MFINHRRAYVESQIKRDFPSSLGFWVGLLDDDEEKVLVWGNENLLSASAHSEERHVIDWVDVANNRASLYRQVSHVVSNGLWGGRRRRLVSLCDDSALIVHDEQGTNTLVVTDPVDSLLKIGHFKFSVTIINF